MKKKSILLPCLFLAVSIYAILRSGQISLFDGQGEWSVLAALVGLAFLYQGHKEADNAHFFAGLLLAAIGVYFAFKQELFGQADDFTAVVLIAGCALFIRSLRTKEYQFESFLMIAFALYLYFFNRIIAWLQSLKIETFYVEAYWPAALIAVSLLLLFLKRK
ncbi:membrane protein [Bacillus glycinifermentans]|uniref:DUF5668 domain-containing protein n=1 Tax=Bacillus glycinifermentans TaxID=1664069 RepID=A0A0J6HJH0_9BACI|nr:hypothetical protein [Bacillus glycinifermentans]ATH92662.1 hypothetical protein COP00_08560 [Bacillus glycinifermentans]KMM59342.1 membrane protein [Bacillus glycinifermentans]KRT94062.1 hypothetical protein AB447_215595 [Bacillus glycinifermentans]MEC0487453.1 hypothetical protein [Bacillus glycinifermentans]MEC0493427.1 hypothetical protein [Bacillus glycinifermentans]